MTEKPAYHHIFSVVAVSAFFLCACLLSASSSLQAAASDGNPSKDGRVTLLEDREYYPAFMKAIDSAKSEIVMSFFLFKTNGHNKSYSDKILAGLVRAAKRGVRVRIILEEAAGTRESRTDTSNRKTAARLRSKGVDVCFDSPDTTTHTKVAVIDKRFIFLGSHNLTNSALQYNHELSVVIDSPPLAMETLHYIDSLQMKAK